MLNPSEGVYHSHWTFSFLTCACWRGWYYPSRISVRLYRYGFRVLVNGLRLFGAMLPRCFHAIDNFSLLLTQHLSVLSNHSEKLLYEWKTRSFDAESRPCGQRWTWNRDNTRRARQSCAYRCGRRCPHWVDQRTCWGRALANEHLGGHRQV